MNAQPERRLFSPEQIAASMERLRLRRIAELERLQVEVESAIRELRRTGVPHMDDADERNLLDAAYDVFEVEGLWEQARQYGPRGGVL